MLAVLALVAFVIAAILKLIAKDPQAQIWLIIAGGILVSAHCLWGYYPWRTRAGAP
ncbi:MAG: hypothetical protein ACLQI7_03950 [Streptosporangiaceae bacterium]